MTHADRLRSDIDAGRTADKVAFPDPAAAPLGTDDEAAGAAPTVGRVEAADHSAAPAPAIASTPADERGRPYADPGTSFAGVSFTTAVVILLLAIVALAAAGAFLFA